MSRIILTFLFCLPFVLPAQTEEHFTLEGNFSIAGIDMHGNSYVVMRNTLYKYDAGGMQEFNFSDNNKGSITHVNVSNPLKITVLFADLGMLTVLDHTLSPIGDLNLHQLNISDPLVVCTADDNGFWVYDASTGFFSMIGWNGQLIRQSVNAGRLFSTPFYPKDMVMYSGHILALAESGEVIMLDNAGNIAGVFPEDQGITSVGASGVCYLGSKMIWILNPLTTMQSSLSFSSENVKNFSLHFPYILVEYEKKISLYLLTAQ
jgi:outer membrane protein assembly factor BamB